jgi:diphosphomevalonate decarboxylase
MKQTAVAPSNIAFIKYWGKIDEILRLPANGSISMNLSGLMTTTTVEFTPALIKDDVTIDGMKVDKEASRVSKHLDRIREIAHINTYARVVSNNNFPASTGLSSSASGFAALTVAAVAASGLSLPEKELSILARLGSGSACRSIPDGYTEWIEGTDSNSSYAHSLHSHTYWNLVDIVAIVSREKKEIPTSEGQKEVTTSPFYTTRLSQMNEKLRLCTLYLKTMDFTALGNLAEQDALNMHAVMITSTPSLLYWTPNTIALMKEIQKWRKEGVEAYFTINTGQDVHIICQGNDAEAIHSKVKGLPYVSETIVNRPAIGAHITDTHLF